MVSEKTTSQNIVDILITPPGRRKFARRVAMLGLSPELEAKCIAADQALQTASIRDHSFYLTPDNEKELATEILLNRHRFTELINLHQPFRQAALSVIQNIYLSRERRIFFDGEVLTTEQERQAALQLFGSPEQDIRIPLGKTLQHSILARIWHRIVLYTMDNTSGQQEEAFLQLLDVVERLNTLRNIYILLTTGLVRKLTARISGLYRQSVSREDAWQIGTFGVARAAYRYHHSCGGRFSTFASFWVMREVQRHALGGRLIRIPAALVEQLSKVARQKNTEKEQQITHQLRRATTLLLDAEQDVSGQISEDPAAGIERQEMHRQLSVAIDTVLSAKSADIIKRRYGLGEYVGGEQSIIAIARAYGVTRGSVYQLEQAALIRLKKHLSAEKVVGLPGE